MKRPATPYRELAEFRYQIRRFLNFSEQAARQARIEPQQHQALLALQGLPPASEPTVGVLAERMQIQHHSAVELAGRMEVRGWIRRARSRKDRRAVLLRLTRRGERLLARLSRLHDSELRQAGPRLLEALRSVLAHERRPSATAGQIRLASGGHHG